MMGVIVVSRKLLRKTLCILMIMSLLIAPVNATAASSKKVISIFKVTADGARLRKGGSSAYDVITSLRKGDNVFYLNKKSNAFCYVITATGQKGYVYQGFLKSYGAATLKQVYYSNTKGVKLYKRASTKSSRVTTLSSRQFVLVYQAKNGWAYVRTLSGKGGYVRAKYLKKAG